MPKISVIMSVYNTKEEWLKEAIESILNQTFSDFEFIIINDGSTNNAEDVILSYKDERIKYLKQENQGLAKSLNNGLKIAEGEYIARMDSDDISLPNRLQKQVDFLDSNKDISVLGTWFEVFPKREIIKHPGNVCYMDLLYRCSVGHPTVMFRRLDFEKYDLKYNPDYKCEDYELWSRAIRILKIANLQEVLLKYRCHEDNLSKPTQDFLEYDQKVKRNMLEFLTSDKELQEKIQDIVFDYNTKYTFAEKMFSLKNEYRNSKKCKVLRLFGLKIRLKKVNKGDLTK